MLADRCEGFGGKPTVTEPECARAFSAEVSHEADGAARRLLAELVDARGGNEENRSRSDRKPLGPDALLAVAAQIKQKLAVGVPVRRVALEGLEVAVDIAGL